MNWLREFVPVELPADTIAERLTAAGLAVDAIEAHGRFDRFVGARIVALASHPQAERLQVCTVDAGTDGTLQIVSGAPNLRVGQRVALALPGARLSNGQVIESIEIRGLGSQGAVVSEREIGLSDDGSGVMELAADARPGAPLSQVLGTEDSVLEIDVTPNRGDCLSILGVAREVAALTGTRLRDRRARLSEALPRSGDSIRVEIRESQACARYVARVLRGIKVAPSPIWMRARLEALGVRSINNVVDVTNYVMLERGQPLHAFDLAKVRGGSIVVRLAGDRLRFTTLDGIERELDPGDLVIADAEGPVAIAGVMGGLVSSVTAETRDVLLEAAWFEPSTVRRSSRRSGLRSESSMRFERGVDVEGVPAASLRAAELLAKVTGAEVAVGEVDVFARPLQPIEVLVRSERVNRLLGTSFSVSEIGQSLRRVSAEVQAAGKGGYRCRPPSWRSDLSREADFVEEVARLLGYDRIPETLPRVPMTAGRPAESTADEIRRLLVAEGMVEMISLRFSSPRGNELLPGLAPAAAKRVSLQNPLGADTSEMRSSVLPGLLAAARRNRNQGEPCLRGFELGAVFWREPSGELIETQALGGVLRGPLSSRGVLGDGREQSFHDAKGVLEALFEGLSARPVRWVREEPLPFLHPGKAAKATVDGVVLGYVGGLHPAVGRELDLAGDVWVFELDIGKLGFYRSPRVTFQPLPRVPAVVRDLAIVAGQDMEAQAVLDLIAEREDLLVESVHLFDVYSGAPLPQGKKSLAFSIAYRAMDRTLTDEEVNRLHERLTGMVTSRLGVDLRR